MAHCTRSKREGYRDWFYIWTTFRIESDYNFILPVLVQKLNMVIVPWNSSITQVQEAVSEKVRPAIYEFTFGAVSSTVADRIVVEVTCKMEEMEAKREQLRALHEPEEWFVDKNQE